MASFGSNITTPLDRLRTIQQGATTFARDIVLVLTAAFGEGNTFGTASQRDTGTGSNNVPLLNNEGELDPNIIPAATTSTRGAVRLAGSIEDTGDDVVPPLELLRLATPAVGSLLDANNFDVEEITTGIQYTTPAIGLLFVASSGGGGSTPGVANGGTATSSTISLGTVYPTSASNTITAAGGGGGGDTRVESSGFDLLPVNSNLNNHPDFAMILYGKGAPGGDPGSFDPDTNMSSNEIAGLPGDNGNLIIAKFNSGDNFRVDIGAAGAGADARTTTTNQRSVAARDGKTGYAFFMRLA